MLMGNVDQARRATSGVFGVLWCLGCCSKKKVVTGGMVGYRYNQDDAIGFRSRSLVQLANPVSRGQLMLQVPYSVSFSGENL